MKSMTFNLHFTDTCNYKCRYCFVKKCGKELEFEKICKIIDKLSNWLEINNIHGRINLAGGEPLLSPNIQKIIDYISNKNMSVSVITNGYYLTKDFICKNKEKIQMIGISVDSLNSKTNNLAGRCCVDKSLNYQKLIQLCKCINHNGIKLKINTCVNALNINEDLDAIYKLLNPDRMKYLRVMINYNLSLKQQLGISNLEWNNFVNKQRTNIPKELIFEDNSYMQNNYIIIDSEGNLSRDNLHLTNNSLLNETIDSCLQKIN